jgi:hypothetical protein
MLISAGSSGGDSNAAQFIVDNRAVLLEYAREGGDKTTSKEGGNPRYLGSNREGKKPYAPRSDWLCASVSLSRSSLSLSFTCNYCCFSSVHVPQLCQARFVLPVQCCSHRAMFVGDKREWLWRQC